MRFGFACYLFIFLFYVQADTFTANKNTASVENCLNVITSLQTRVGIRMFPVIYNSFQGGGFENIHKGVIDIIEVWATDLIHSCCVKVETESNVSDPNIILRRIERANDFLENVNKWLQQFSNIISFDKVFFNHYKAVVLKFQTLIDCLIDQVPKGSPGSNLEIKTLVDSFDKFKKNFD